MESDEGEAWSECVTAEAPDYSCESPETAWRTLTDYVLPAVLGSELQDPAAILGLQSADAELLRQVEGHLESGTRKIKIKIKPGRDVEMLRNVRDRFPDAPLMADANSAYVLADAPRLKELDALDLMMVEQPVRRSKPTGLVRRNAGVRGRKGLQPGSGITAQLHPSR